LRPVPGLPVGHHDRAAGRAAVGIGERPDRDVVQGGERRVGQQLRGQPGPGAAAAKQDRAVGQGQGVVRMVCAQQPSLTTGPRRPGSATAPSPRGGKVLRRDVARTGHQFPHLVAGGLAGGVPHHSFHVFEIYPWLGLLRDDRRHATALNVLDRCRIRWGEVLAITGDEAVVRSRPLVWDRVALAVGVPVVESAKYAVNGTGFVAGLAAGDVVSLHWDWVCDRLSPHQLQQLLHFTARHLRIANDGVEHRGAAIALERST
jgi:Family of unknown function (DUF6390)